MDQGTLAVHDLGPRAVDDDARVVLAVHGITANGLSWRAVADELARRRPGAVRLLAPDLRGRAASADLPGPFGLGVHAEDVAGIASSLPGPPVLVGHSMGAYVAALTAVRHPSQVAGAVLVDGGFAFPPPPDLDVDAALTAVLGPAMERLSMRFGSPEDYLAFWDEHPALGPVLRGPGGDVARRYVLHDLVEAADGSGWRSSCVLDAVRADGAGVLADEEAHTAARRAVLGNGLPVELVWARRGLLDEPQGLFDADRVAALDLPPALRVTEVDANHYSVVLEDPGVSAVADAVERLLDAGSR